MTDEKDVAVLLNIDQHRADEIIQLCYDNIAQMQEDGVHEQMSKSIEAMRHVGKSADEQFYSGFILGRTIQTHIIAVAGLTSVLTDDVDHIERAKDKFKAHPEFG